MPINISIACLIYKSTRWLQFVYDQVRKYTDLTNNEFYFVANDAHPTVLQYLIDHKIPHYVHNNTEEQRKEWYINNVYRACNTACKMAKGEYVVLINSDMAFTPGWLESLVSKMDDRKMVTSRLVERGILPSGTHGIEVHFGNNPSDYNEEGFLRFAKQISLNVYVQGGLYMPCLLKKEHVERIGYYPEGNIIPGSNMFDPVYAKIGEPCIPGDKVFVEKLKTIGVEHWTAFDSIVYHFQQGEMLDTVQ